MSMTTEEATRVQAGYNELRRQRDDYADRCANMALEIASRDQMISDLQDEFAALSKKLAEARGGEPEAAQSEGADKQSLPQQEVQPQR